MGVLSKLAFWKKKDDFSDIGKDLGLDKDMGFDGGAGPSPDLGMGLEPMNQQTQHPFQQYPSMQQSQSGFQQPSFTPPQPMQQALSSGDSYINSKNLEVISSKLDALRATLDSINQRLSNIESIARGEQEDFRKRRYY
jgi:hypothetical protein